MKLTDYERIEALIKYADLSARALSLRLGLKNPQIFYDIKAGKCGISKDLASKIQELFLDVDRVWLLTGEGEMLLTEKKVENNSTNSSEGVNFVPVLPIAAQGGSLNDFTMSISYRDCEQITSPISGADFAMPIAGDSMSPDYPSGSQVLVKKIDEKAFIEWGKTYVLDTCNGSVIKTLMPSEESDRVRCISINRDYPPFEIRYSDIFGVYRVMMLMAIK